MFKELSKASALFDLPQLRRYGVVAAVFSLFLNLLYLGPSIYMLQVYDRVMGSGSISTLVYLTIALVILFVTMMVLDTQRTQVMARAGVRFDRMLHQRVLAAAVSVPETEGSRSQAIRDLDALRGFISSPGMQALFDLPWFPIYLFAIFLLHPVLGLFTIGVGILLVALAIANEVYTSAKSLEAGTAALKSYGFVEMALRNRETIEALGMAPTIVARSAADRLQMQAAQVAAMDRSSSVQGLIKTIRMLAQSLMLAIGAYLVIERQMSSGGIFAGMLLLGRALQPIELTIGAWRSFLGAKESYLRLQSLLEKAAQDKPPMALPKPLGALRVENVTYLVPGTRAPILRNVSFKLEPGEVLGLIGPSGAGKSTLARVLMGILPPTAGSIRLDGAELSQWSRDQIGPYIGYLPQTIELFADSVAANIARLGPIDPAAVIAAAQLAGTHDLILELPQGYDTRIGEGGGTLSGGFRQRIALARAVYGQPSFVLLDEPSSNLDAKGDDALAACIMRLKALGTTVVVISHRPHTVNVADKVLVLEGGSVTIFGERREVIARLSQPQAKRLGTA